MEVKPDTPNHSRVEVQVIGILELNILVKIRMMTRKVYQVLRLRINKRLLRLMKFRINKF